MSLEERGGTLWVAGTFYHGFYGRRLALTVSHNENMPRGQDHFQSHGRAPGWRVVAGEPFAVRFDRGRFQVQHAASRIFGAARFVEAEMAIFSETKHDDVQS